ncbi:MAG TPA: HEPN domain-containing protein, partial [Phormidium sp.]
SLLTAYVSYLNSIIPKYEEIPKQIAKNHISLSFALISLSEQSRYQGVVTATQLISNLHSCTSNSKDYRINAEAFAQHTANFRDEVIQSSFAQIGIDGVSGRVKNSSAFIEYLELKYPERDIGSIKPQDYLFYLNDLAERRNQVAHGSLPDELLSNQILLDYITFFEAYGQALYEVVYSDALYYAVKYQGIELGTPKQILKNRTVVGIAVKNTLIRVGDLLVAQTANNALLYLAGEILELQVDNVSYKEVPSNAEGMDMGIRVPFKAKKNQKFFLIPKQVRKTETG